MSPFSIRCTTSALILLLAQSGVGHCQTSTAIRPLDIISADRPNLSYHDLALALLILRDYQAQVKAHYVERDHKTKVSVAILVLAYSRTPQALESLAENMDFSGEPTIASGALDILLALRALTSIGAPAQQFIVDAIASSANAERSLPMAEYALTQTLSNNASTQNNLRSTILVYATDYHRQASSLRALTKQLPDVEASLPIASPIGVGKEDEVVMGRPPAMYPKTLPMFWDEVDPISLLHNLPNISITDERVTRLARILDLQDVLWDESDQANEARSVAAIKELGELHALEVAPALANKLDWEVGAVSPKDKQIPPMNAATIKGKVSPAITEAAKQALEQLGPDALPAIMNASAMCYRLPRFRKNALEMIVKLSGGKKQANAILKVATKSEDTKRQRLLNWLKKVDNPTP